MPRLAKASAAHEPARLRVAGVKPVRRRVRQTAPPRRTSGGHTLGVCSATQEVLGRATNPSAADGVDLPLDRVERGERGRERGALGLAPVANLVEAARERGESYLHVARGLPPASPRALAGSRVGPRPLRLRRGWRR